MSTEDGQKLSDAAFAGDLPKLDGLLATGIAIDTCDKDGFTALHRSCVTGNATVINFLLDKGAKVNMEDSYGDTPLHYACFCGHLEVAKLLVSKGADAHRASRDGKTPLQSAQEEGHTSLVTALGGTVTGGAGAMPAAPGAGGSSGPAAYVAPAAPSILAAAGGAAAVAGAGPAGPPRMIGGLDFSRGVILEGELRKKRANKVMKWRRKYYILSRTYAALFFWTGTRDRVEGIIKKVRFETFFAVRHFPTKQGGKRFELRVVTGRAMQLLGASPDDARRWVSTLKSVLGGSMAVIRIQAAWRGYRARRQLKKMRTDRARAVALVSGGAGAGAGGSGSAGGGAGAVPNRNSLGASAHAVHGTIKTGAASAGLLARAATHGGEDKALDVTVSLRADGVLMEGELKKKNSTVMSSLFTAYRTRYFVLYTPDAALYYFDSKAQRQLGTRPRAIPFLSFFAVFQVCVDATPGGGQREVLPGAGGRPRASSGASGLGGGVGGAALTKTNRFKLRVTSGRVFEFEARSPAAAELWVSKLLAVLPRDNAAAIKIQAAYRAHRARVAFKKMLAEAASVVRTLTIKYAGPPYTAEKEGATRASTRRVQSYLRMRVARRAYARALALRLEAEAAALGAGAGGSGAAAPGDISASATAARLAKLRELRALKAAGAAPAAAAAGAAAAAAASSSPWKKYADPGTGRPYWHNAATNETTWADPEAPVWGEWRELTDAASGRTYFHNTANDSVVWELPADAAALKAAALKRRRARWIRKREGDGSSGRVYFANVDSGETCWGIPPGMAEGQARLLGHWFPKEVAATPAAPGDAAPGRYYVHAESSTTTWERPDGYESDEDHSAKLLALADWVEVIDPSSGKPYYFHKGTQERSWVHPWGAFPLSKEIAPAAADAGAAAAAADEPAAAAAAATSPAAARPSVHTNASLLALGAASSGRTSIARHGSVFAGQPGGALSAASSSAGSRRSISTRRTSAIVTPAPVGAGALGGLAAATAAAALDASSPWQSAQDPRTNRTYWFNSVTGESSWEPPAGVVAPAAAGAAASAAEAADGSETMTFTLFLNHTLEAAAAASPSEHGNEAVASRLPVSLEGSPAPLFAACRDGILLCRLVHALAPDTLDPRAVDYSAVPLEEGEREARRRGLSRRLSVRPPGVDGASAAGDESVAAALAGSGAGVDSALENCRLALSAAAAAGCVFGRDVTATGLAEGRPQSVLDFLWQCCKLASVNGVSLRASGNMGLLRLALEGEGADELLALAPETLLLRWVRHHCSRVAPPCAAAASLQAFGEGCLADGTALCALVRAVLPDTLTAAVPAGDEAVAAAGAEAAITAALSASFGAGVPAWFGVDGISGGNMRLQMALLAYLFKAAPGLDAAAPPSAASAAAADAGKAAAAGGRPSAAAASAAAGAAASRERANTRELTSLTADIMHKLAAAAPGGASSSEAGSVAQWINSLDIEGIYVRGEGLAPALRDGTVLLQILDVVQPGLVAWHKVNMRAHNRYKQVENCNLVISLGRAMDFHLVNVGGLDICDGNVKLILAYLWQVMRYHTLQQLSKLAFDGFTAEEGEILRWANGKVAEAAAAAGQTAEVRVSSFADPELSSGIYLLYLLAAIRPGCVDWSLVADGADRPQQLSNARYVLSIARRLGAQVFATASDIVEARSKPLMLFVASLMVAETRERKGLAQATDGEPQDSPRSAAGGAGAGWPGAAISEELAEEDDEDEEHADDSDEEDEA